jgi:hypothetical protein
LLHLVGDLFEEIFLSPFLLEHVTLSSISRFTVAGDFGFDIVGLLLFEL